MLLISKGSIWRMNIKVKKKKLILSNNYLNYSSHGSKESLIVCMTQSRRKKLSLPVTLLTVRLSVNADV